MAAITETDLTHKGGAYIHHKRGVTIDAKPRFKCALITLPTATTSSDTTTVNLAQDLGIKRLMGFVATQHTTENSVMELEETSDSVSVTAIQNDTLTISVNGSANPLKRTYLLYGL